MNLDALNPMQRLAADTLEGPVLILAGAGSGKTRTVTYRIANLIEHGTAAYRILALTFTNKAAREMRERVSALIGDAAQEAWIGTFHSVCVRILRRDIEKLGYQRSFTIYDDDDQQRVIKDILKQMNIDDKVITPREVKSKLSDAKNHLLSPDEWFSKTDRDYHSQKVHDIMLSYQSRLKAANALDFDDILTVTLQLLCDHPPVLEYYRNRFQYVHVDEYQDTNFAQYSLVKLLTQESRNLCVVGDDDQSIYGWRGADIRNILDFEKDFPDAKVIKLEQNYRSTANILDAANQVIAHNETRKEKALWTDQGAGEPIKFYTAGDEREEAAWICDQIRHLNRKGVSYGDIAILYRMHAQSRVIEEMMMRAGIPYKVFGGTRFYDRKEIKDVVAYLRLMVNPSDNIALKRIINTPKRSIGDATVSLLEQYAQEQQMPLFSALTMLPDSLSSRPRKCIGEFAHLLNKLSVMRETMPLTKFVEAMLEETGLKNQLSDEDSEEAATRLQNVMEFVGAVQEFENQSDDKTLEAFLENVALVSDLDSQEGKPQYVTMMTLHSAKGLEYDVVFLAGLEEGIFPSNRSMMDENRMEEERRLCYVGITRARKLLHISLARHRTLFNQVMHNAPSCFIKEIPERLLDDEWAVAQKQHFGVEPNAKPERTEYPQRRSNDRRNLSFGTPGMGLKNAQTPTNPLNIPGVQRGFVPSKARTEAVKNLFKPGDIVLHKKFGEGTVQEVKGSGSEARIAIAFTAYGVKEFALSIAPIVKVDDR